MKAGRDSTRRSRGTIERLSSGAYRAKVYAGVDPNTRRRLYLTDTVPAGPKAEKDAEKALTRLKRQVDEQLNPRTRRTLAQLLDEYLKVANLDPGTLRGYQRNRKNHVDKLLGSKQLSQINARVLDDFYAELRRCRKHCDGKPRIEHRVETPHTCDERCIPHECEGLSSSTVRRIHFLLSGAFKRAVRWGWVAVNPCSSAEPPAERKPEPQPPTPEQAARIINATWQDPDWGTFIWVAMTTGARRAELCALRWSDLDLDRSTMSVSRSIDQHGTGTAEKMTKSHQHRRIALDPETTAVLRDHRDRWNDRLSSLDATLPDEAFVFSSSPDGSQPLKPDTATQRYGRLAQRLKIATTLHKLRHFSATELIAAGVDPRTVSGRLGHADGGSTTLRVYSAWVSESDQRAAGSLAARMPPRPPLDRTERAKYYPEAPYEKVAAEIRHRVLDGTLKPGEPAPTHKQLQRAHHVSGATANRVVELLKEWKLVEASRGRRAVVLTPPDSEPTTASATGPETETRATTGKQLLDLNLVHLGTIVRTFATEADPHAADELRRILNNAARRHDKTADLADYELEVRASGSERLLMTFAAL